MRELGLALVNASPKSFCGAAVAKMETSSREPVRVGIIGVGNCASSFVQGLSYYRNVGANEPAHGLMNAELGGYHVRDIEISAAFDISVGKVGRDLAGAIVARPNNT